MKKLMLICAPVSSRSGYGDHARDLVRSFINLNKFFETVEIEIVIDGNSLTGLEFSSFISYSKVTILTKLIYI